MGDEKFYFLTLDKGRIIDAEYMGSKIIFLLFLILAWVLCVQVIGLVS